MQCHPGTGIKGGSRSLDDLLPMTCSKESAHLLGYTFLLMGKIYQALDSPISVFQGKLRIFVAVQLGEEGKIRL